MRTSTNVLIRPVRCSLLAGALVALALAALWSAAPVEAQSAPFTAYGVGLEAGDVVEARIGSKVCGSAEADASGNWLLYITSTDPCSPTEGAKVTFRLNGKATDASATYTPGGAPSDVAKGITLTVSQIASAGTFSTTISAGINLVVFSGGPVESAVEAAPNARAFFVSVDGALVPYVVGAPSFVNASFFATFEDGELPADTFMIVVAE